MHTDTGTHIPEPSDTVLIHMCQRAPLIAGSSFGNRIVRLSDVLIAKYGLGVWSEEAKNQQYAYAHVDHSVLYVPKVVRYFEDSSQGSRVGYLIMEYICGTPLDSVDISPLVMTAVAKAIAHLSTIPAPKHQGPGPVGQGVSRGYLWPEEGAYFNSVEEMQVWMNRRLAAVSEKRLNLTSHRLAMRHMDLVRRNIILRADSSICFVDWAYAGFYPELFEIQYFRDLCPVDPVYFGFLLEHMHQPTLDEEQALALLAIPAAVNLRYFFEDASRFSSCERKDRD